MLLLTLITSILTFSLPRTNLLLGCVHLLLFGAYLMLMFRPMNALSRMARSLSRPCSGRNRPMQTGHALRTRGAVGRDLRKAVPRPRRPSRWASSPPPSSRASSASPWTGPSTADGHDRRAVRRHGQPLHHFHVRHHRAGGHESVRAAARRFVRAAEPFHDDGVPAIEFEYPPSDSGLVLPAHVPGRARAERPDRRDPRWNEPLHRLFESGQAVLTELRKVSEPAR